MQAMEGLSTSHQQPKVVVVERKVTSHKGDTSTIPFFKHTMGKIVMWLIPAMLLFSKCIGPGIMEVDTYNQIVLEVEGKMDATIQEKSWLIHNYYDSISTKHITLVPAQGLAQALEDQTIYQELLIPLVTSILVNLSTLDCISSTNSSNDDVFPTSIPPCPINEADIWEAYSLPSCHPSSKAKGTIYGKQVAALYKSRVDDPPISIFGNITKVKESTIDLLVHHLDQYLGFCYLYFNMEPTMGLVMVPSMFAKYVAFLKVSVHSLIGVWLGW